MKIPDEPTTTLAHQVRGDPRRLRPASAQIIDLARVRAERSHLSRQRRALVTPVRYYLAASLLIGIALGAAITRLNAGSALTRYHNGLLFAQGSLAQALDEQLTGHALPSARIRIGGTYRSKSGNYCRTFAIAGSQSLAGLACREHEQWQLLTLLNNAAGTAPVNGAALTTAAETMLRSRDWQ
jgi:hypothetical protein